MSVIINQVVCHRCTIDINVGEDTGNVSTCLYHGKMNRAKSKNKTVNTNSTLKDHHEWGWSDRLLSDICDDLNQNAFTDVDIITKDGVLSAHQLILSFASPYFRTMFNSSFYTEGQTKKVSLIDISRSEMEVILTFIYTGKVSLLDAENAMTIMQLGDYFQIAVLKKLCATYLKENMDQSGCGSLEIYEFASSLNCTELASYAMELARSHCHSIVRNGGFTEMCTETIALLLKGNRSIFAECDLLKAVINWAIANSEERSASLPSLLEHLDLGCLNAQEHSHYLELMQKHNLSTEYLALAFRDSSSANASDVSESHNLNRRTEMDVVLAIGGNTKLRDGNHEAVAHMETFRPYPEYQWSRSTISDAGDGLLKSVALRPMMDRRAFAASTQHEGQILMAGGLQDDKDLSTCEWYLPKENSWHRFDRLPVALHGASAVCFEKKLYVAGGTSGDTTLKTLWMYDFEKPFNSWVARCPMLGARSHFALVAAQDCLVAIGGMEGEVTLATCEKYDPSTNMWIKIAGLKDRRAFFGAASVHGRLFVMGGNNQMYTLKSVEIYNSWSNTWYPGCPMMCERTSFGVAINQCDIYAIGGMDGKGAMSSVERYSSCTNMWHSVPNLVEPRYGLCGANLVL